MVPFLSIKVTSLADVDTVYSWVQKTEIESGSWISPSSRPKFVSSGVVVVTTNPSYRDGLKWNG